MDGKLAEDGADDVEVEDIVLRAFLGECFNGLLIISGQNEKWIR